MPKSRGAGPHPQDATAACGAAGLPAVAGGKDCLRSATALAASRQQRPTANSETLTSPACCRTSRRLMLLSVVNEKLSRLQFCALQRVPLALALQSCAVAATWQDGC